MTTISLANPRYPDQRPVEVQALADTDGGHGPCRLPQGPPHRRESRQSEYRLLDGEVGTMVLKVLKV